MGEKTITVKGLVGCSGPWGSLRKGEVKKLAINDAGPLLGAGFAELAEPTGTSRRRKETATRGPSETPEA